MPVGDAERRQLRVHAAGDVHRGGAPARFGPRAGHARGDLVPHRRRHLVTPPADGRPGTGGDPGDLRAEPDHGLDRGRHDTGDQPRPARVRRGGDTGLRVGEQDGRAVGGQHGEREAAARGDHGVDGGNPGVAPGSVDHGHVAAVHLVHPDDPRRIEPPGTRGALPVGENGGGVVADRAAEIELRVRGGAHSAPPVGEGEMSAAPRKDRNLRAHCVVRTYHFKKSGTSSSSAWESE